MIKINKDYYIQISGWEKVKLKSRKCHHMHKVLVCTGKEDFAYCKDCGIRTPSQVCANLAWAETMFEMHKNRLFLDLENTTKCYFLNFDTGEITECYVVKGVDHEYFSPSN